MERYAHLMDITALSGFSIRLALAIILGFFVGLSKAMWYICNIKL